MENKLFMLKNCEFCENEMEIPLIKVGKRKGEVKGHKRFCSTKCQINWQQTTPWEERIGKDRADEIRQNMSKRSSGINNPSCDPLVAKKISVSLKQYLKENPRNGDKNPFFGKEHTSEYKQWASESRKGKWSYTEEGHQKQLLNTPSGENHPNWQGGISFGEYDIGFNNQKKRLIRIRDNHTCQICNSIDGDGVVLHIHHIDYDKQNSCEENLIALCNACHLKTNWKRESWIQFFKPIMESKYFKGK